MNIPLVIGLSDPAEPFGSGMYDRGVWCRLRHFIFWRAWPWMGKIRKLKHPSFLSLLLFISAPASLSLLFSLSLPAPDLACLKLNPASSADLFCFVYFLIKWGKFFFSWNLLLILSVEWILPNTSKEVGQSEAGVGLNLEFGDFHLHTYFSGYPTLFLECT